MPGSVIVGGARTPIGKLSGSLKSFTAMDLGGIAIAAALDIAGITGDQVDYVIMGHVIQAGAGQITARQAAVNGGIPHERARSDGERHPVGASGARLALHLALELRRCGGGLGAAALCGGGGQGEALLLRVSA